MKLGTTTLGAAAVGLVLCGSPAPLAAQGTGAVNNPQAIHEQTARHLEQVLKKLGTLGTPETVYDYIHPGVSGPVVVLQGFTVNGALKDDAQKQVESLGWVVHVVNQIEYLDHGPELRRARGQILGILQRQVPQAFPENHANIRIKVTVKGDVTLLGVVRPNDKLRLEAAVEQIKHVPMIASVTNQIVEATD